MASCAVAASGLTLLGGCGGDGDGQPTPVAANTGSVSPAAVDAVPVTDTQLLNFVLNLLYVSAQFHSYAATGTGLPAALLGGVGTTGSVGGGRTASLSDPLVMDAANFLATDKQARIVALRSQLGAAAAAMPAVDLNGSAGGAFARVGSAIGAGAFDPYADDARYLIGALAIDYATAAVQRGLFARMEDAAASAVMGDALAGSIHHGALLRTLLDARFAADPNSAAQVDALHAAFAVLDGSGAADTSITDGGPAGTNLMDGAGRPIPFTREIAQIKRLAFLDAYATTGGFLPNGMNGMG